MPSRDLRDTLHRAWPGHAEVAATDAGALTRLAALPGPFVPWSAYSMRPTAIADILSDICLYDRRAIVECGSGNSTIYMARLIRQRGSEARVISIDHDPVWASSTRRALEFEGLADVVTVVDAPLVDGWYDTSAIPATPSIDLLVIDGPPAWQKGFSRARERALDHFAPSLAPGSTVVLDDANRPGEQAVLKAWTKRHGREFVTLAGGQAMSSPHLP